MSGSPSNPIVTGLRTWRCQRREVLFDSARTGHKISSLPR